MRKHQGITFIEVVVAVAILAVVAGLGVIGVRFFNDLMWQRVAIEVQRDSQVTLYLMTKDIRTADAILSLNGTPAPTPFCVALSSCVALRTYDTSLGFDVGLPGDPNNILFSPANVSTITYVYVPAVGNVPTYLRRIVEGKGNVKDDKQLLRGFIQLNPDSTQPPLFQAFPLGSTPPFSGVDIHLYLSPQVFHGGSREFNINVMVRGRT